jgi:hypothetical protein
MPVYTPNIPQPGDNISGSQNQILENFQTANTAFGSDHTAFDVVASQGKHKQVTLIQNTAPGATVDPASIIHSVLGTGTIFLNKPLPFFRNSLGDYPLMPDLKVVGSNYGFKIGNIIINFGGNTITIGNTTVTSTWAIPYTNPIIIILTTLNNQSTFDAINAILRGAPSTVVGRELLDGVFNTNSAFAHNVILNYLAIGY